MQHLSDTYPHLFSHIYIYSMMYSILYMAYIILCVIKKYDIVRFLEQTWLRLFTLQNTRYI